MRAHVVFLGALSLCGAMASAATSSNDTSPVPRRYAMLDLRDDRPDGCPPCPQCFDCHYDEFKCLQFANCSETSGRCICPPGFGGDNCGEVMCGSPADKENRPVRTDSQCTCREGWSGINCNVCTENKACNALMPNEEGGICYEQGLVVNKNYQMCDVTNDAIRKQLNDQKPQVTFSCDASDHSCNFQFWVDQEESFYCALNQCEWEETDTTSRNNTAYHCKTINCSCVPGRMLCGKAGSVDIGEFLSGQIKGPADFVTQKTVGGNPKDGSRFEEPAMNGLISSIFGDEYITLDCFAGECLHYTQVPGFTKPVKDINTPLIAGVIAGCALFIVGVFLTVWYLTRRAAIQKGGFIRVGEDGDGDPAKMMIDHKPMPLQFQNVSYALKGKQILSKISGIAQPGQVMAIMGASGAGKSTFLDILARKNKRGEVSGAMYVNGEKILDHEYRNVIGYVDQEDALLPTLTVHETILTSAKLRLPADMSNAIKEQRAIEVMQQLGIYQIKDQLIGSEEGSGRGISGGEKRRVGIACELVTSPSILFLDEPTSGLDAFNAFNVVECLVTLAKTYNRTVIFTIHQPRSNIVALFDQLVLLCKGETVYSGPFPECQAYFDSIGYTCPPGFNIADYLVDLTMHASMPRTQMLEDDVREDDLSETDGLLGGDSSTRAIKSIKSTVSAATSMLDNAEGSIRPQHKRKISLKQKQDRLLFTRKSSEGPGTPPTPRTDEEDVNFSGQRGNTSNSIVLSRRESQIPPQIPEDSDDLQQYSKNDLETLVASFRASRIFKATHQEIASSIHTASSANGNTAANGDHIGPVTGSIKSFRRIGIPRQFLILSQRTWRNLYRNPVLMLTHYAVAIVLAVLSGWLFYGIADNIGGFQNRLGLFFFLLALFGFSTLTSLNTFASERLIFIRERANGYYSPLAYYLSKMLFDIVPLRLIPPILMGVIIYPMTGLLPQWAVFLRFILILVLFNLAAAAICLTIGIIFRDGAVANLVGSLVMLFSLLFAGLLLNLNRETVQTATQWLQMLSIFHFGYEALIVNEVRTLRLIDHRYGLDIEVPGPSILSAFGFDNLAMSNDIIGLAVFAGTFIVIAYICMHFLLVERR